MVTRRSDDRIQRSPRGRRRVSDHPSRRREMVFASAPNAWGFVKWSPDGRQIAFVDQIFGGSVFVMDVDGSAPRRIFDGSRPHGLRALANAWGDDGRALYIKVSNAAGNAEVWVVSSQGAEPRFVTALGDARRRSDQFDFDVARGRMYFTVKDVESDVWVIDVAR